MFLKILNILKPSHVNEHFTYSKMHPTPNWIIMDENQSVDNIARHPVDTLRTPQLKNNLVIDGQ